MPARPISHLLLAGGSAESVDVQVIVPATVGLGSASLPADRLAVGIEHRSVHVQVIVLIVRLSAATRRHEARIAHVGLGLLGALPCGGNVGLLLNRRGAGVTLRTLDTLLALQAIHAIVTLVTLVTLWALSALSADCASCALSTSGSGRAGLAG